MTKKQNTQMYFDRYIYNSSHDRGVELYLMDDKMTLRCRFGMMCDEMLEVSYSGTNGSPTLNDSEEWLTIIKQSFQEHINMEWQNRPTSGVEVTRVCYNTLLHLYNVYEQLVFAKYSTTYF